MSNWFPTLGREKSLVVRIMHRADMSLAARDIKRGEHVGPAMISLRGFLSHSSQSWRDKTFSNNHQERLSALTLRHSLRAVPR